MTRAFTVADVRAACASLPPPGWQKLFDMADPRAAALLIPVVDDDGEAAVILTKRSATMPSHRDDWVFPGGGLDATDTSHAEAARREAAEELGVDPDTIEIVGQLDTRGPIMTGYLIETYVGILSTAELAPDPREVAEVASVRLSALLDAGFRAPIRADHDPGPLAGPVSLGPDPFAAFPGHAGRLNDLRHYPIRAGEHLWGMQADMLYELLDHLTGGGHDF